MPLSFYAPINCFGFYKCICGDSLPPHFLFLSIISCACVWWGRRTRLRLNMRRSLAIELDDRWTQLAQIINFFDSQSVFVRDSICFSFIGQLVQFLHRKTDDAGAWRHRRNSINVVKCELWLKPNRTTFNGCVRIGCLLRVANLTYIITVMNFQVNLLSLN